MSSSVPWKRERERERALITKQKPREDSPISSSPVCSETQHRRFIISLLSISGINFDLKVSIIAAYSGVRLLTHCCCYFKGAPCSFFLFFLIKLPPLFCSVGFSCGDRERTDTGPKRKMVPVKLLILGTQNTGKTGRLSMKVQSNRQTISKKQNTGRQESGEKKTGMCVCVCTHFALCNSSVGPVTWSLRGGGAK